jgi:hypothetical protein
MSVSQHHVLGIDNGHEKIRRPYITQSCKTTSLKQFERIYWHHIQHLRRSMQWLIIYKYHSLLLGHTVA